MLIKSRHAARNPRSPAHPAGAAPLFALRREAAERQAVSRPTLLLLAFACAVLGSTGRAETAKELGSVCVAPLPANAREIDHDYPDGKAPREFRYDFSVQIDDETPVRVEPERSQVLSSLALDKIHRVIIRDGVAVIASFGFTFKKRGANALCLSYGPWYQSWHLEPAAARKWCRCQEDGRLTSGSSGPPPPGP